MKWYTVTLGHPFLGTISNDFRALDAVEAIAFALELAFYAGRFGEPQDFDVPLSMSALVVEVKVKAETGQTGDSIPPRGFKLHRVSGPAESLQGPLPPKKNKTGGTPRCGCGDTCDCVTNGRWCGCASHRPPAENKTGGSE